ncbi:MAG TPA: TIGR00730 family Rossman fold protein [Dissulfurispiraceae bacterium]|nr:TIGR00730 family Rossman fold protein [Dissulfurispiraceae bacterium]
MIRLHFTRSNEEIDTEIDGLIERVGPVCCPELVREMIIAALKAGQESDSRADLKLMNTTMKEMRITGKVFAPYRKIRKVTVFGSARTRQDEPVYQMAVAFGRELAERGFMVITGGGGGIMEAANEGAGPDHSFGVNIRLPFEQKPNETLEGNPRLITYKYFFNRKVAFLKEACAIALFPGGFGTLDEAMESLTLMQTGKANIIPLVLIDEPGGTYWTKWIRFFEDELFGEGYISKSDFSLFKRVDSIAAAIEHIVFFYRRFQSVRYVNGTLVIRMLTPLPEGAVNELAVRYSDMLLDGGKIQESGGLPAEADEPDLAELPRLLVDFNRHDFGRLRSFIGALNTY